MQKFKLVNEVIDNIRKVCNAVAKIDEECKSSRQDLQTLITDMWASQECEIPVKGSEEAKEYWKLFYSSVYPKISAKKQKDHTDREKSQRVSLSRAWNSSLIKTEKELASDIDCENFLKVCNVLMIDIEEASKINALVKRVKNFADFATPEGVSRIVEGAKSAEASRKSAIDAIIREKELELAKLLEEKKEIADSYKVA